MLSLWLISRRLCKVKSKAFLLVYIYGSTVVESLKECVYFVAIIVPPSSLYYSLVLLVNYKLKLVLIDKAKLGGAM
jgi:hypothetical protein